MKKLLFAYFGVVSGKRKRLIPREQPVQAIVAIQTQTKKSFLIWLKMNLQPPKLEFRFQTPDMASLLVRQSRQLQDPVQIVVVELPVTT